MFLDFWSNLLKCHTVNVLYSEKVNLKRGIVLLKSRETLLTSTVLSLNMMLPFMRSALWSLLVLYALATLLRYQTKHSDFDKTA